MEGGVNHSQASPAAAAVDRIEFGVGLDGCAAPVGDACRAFECAACDEDWPEDSWVGQGSGDVHWDWGACGGKADGASVVVDSLWGDDGMSTEFADAGRSRGTHCVEFVTGHACGFDECGGTGHDVAGFEEQSVGVVADHLACAARSGGEHRDAGGHRLDANVGEIVHGRWNGDEIGFGAKACDDAGWEWAVKVDGADGAVVDEFEVACAEWSAGARVEHVAANDVDAELRTAIDGFNSSRKQEVDALARFESSNEKDTEWAVCRWLSWGWDYGFEFAQGEWNDVDAVARDVGIARDPVGKIMRRADDGVGPADAIGFAPLEDEALGRCVDDTIPFVDPSCGGVKVCDDGGAREGGGCGFGMRIPRETGTHPGPAKRAGVWKFDDVYGMMRDDFVEIVREIQAARGRCTEGGGTDDGEVANCGLLARRSGGDGEDDDVVAGFRERFGPSACV